MKRLLLLLSFVFVTAAAAMAQAGAPVTFSCTIDGKAYVGTGKKSLTTTKKKDYKTPPHVQVMLLCNPNANVMYSLDFYLPLTDATLKPGTYPLGDILAAEEKPLPNVYFSLEETKGKDMTTFTSTAPEDGTVEITSVAGGWIEGTFSLTAHSLYGTTSQRAITAGKFKFKMLPVGK